MTPKVKKLYKGARRNKIFLDAINAADGDVKPSIFADNNTKVLFATIYYGWLVSEYGVTWEKYVL